MWNARKEKKIHSGRGSVLLELIEGWRLREKKYYTSPLLPVTSSQLPAPSWMDSNDPPPGTVKSVRILVVPIPMLLFGLEWARKGNCHWCNFYTIIYACKLNLKLSAHYLKGLRTGIMNDWTNEWKVWCRRGVKRVKSGHFSAKITSMGIHSCGF